MTKEQRLKIIDNALSYIKTCDDSDGHIYWMGSVIDQLKRLREDINNATT